MEGGEEEHAGTLVVTVSGQNATRVSYSYMHSILAGPVGLGINGVATLSRYESRTKWYVTLRQATHIIHYGSLHGKTLQLDDSRLTLLIEHLDKERVKGTLHWLPTATKAQMVKRLVTFLTGDEEPEVSRVEKATDKWAFRCRPTQDVPHYTLLASSNGSKEYKVAVTLQGRNTPCPTCGSDAHRANACPKRNRPARRDTTSQQQVPAVRRGDVRPVTLAADPPGQASAYPEQAPEPTDDDGFKLVDHRKKRRHQIATSVSLSPSKSPCTPRKRVPGSGPVGAGSPRRDSVAPLLPQLPSPEEDMNPTPHPPEDAFHALLTVEDMGSPYHPMAEPLSWTKLGDQSEGEDPPLQIDEDFLV